MSARKINQLLEQVGGCTLEQLLAEDESVVQQCKQSNPKLLDYMLQKPNLTKLVEYATMVPESDYHEIAHKFPFAAMEILTSCKQMAQAVCDGGWPSKPDADQDESEEYNDSENKMVRDILGGGANKVSLPTPLTYRCRQTRKKRSSKSSTSLTS